MITLPLGRSQGMAVGMLGGFSLAASGRPVAGLPIGSQRLLVFLALRDRATPRTAIAGSMWPDATTHRAGDSLRSALARMGIARSSMLIASDCLALSDDVVVDYRQGRALAHRLLDSDAPIFDGDLAAGAIATLSRQLLPGWDDDWVIVEAEDWRHLRVTALEALSDRLLAAGRFAEAEGAIRAAIRVDPLRESPYGTLIRIHLADGNQSDALAAFATYRILLREVLDIEPTHHLSDVLSGIRA